MCDSDSQPVLTTEDTEYISANFIALAEACRSSGQSLSGVRQRISQGELPKPSYRLNDGTEMVPSDYFALTESADGRPLKDVFEERYADAARELGAPISEELLAAEWEGYLSGDYGVCLRGLTPENICAKRWHMGEIERLLAEEDPGAPEWRRSLAEHVSALDRLERPFAEYDRVRWGPVSRDRLITGVRERYPDAFR